MQVFVIIASILLLVSLAGFVYYCIKGGNLIIGLIITALLWFLIGTVYTVTNAANLNQVHSFRDAWNLVVGNFNLVFSEGPVDYGRTTAIIIFASWFGRVIVDTGIAKALIRKVVELSGNKQLITVILVSLVSALLFTSVFGPGSVMAIGAIILPILLSIGVSKKIAVGSFLMSVAAGMYVNNGYISQFSGHALFKDSWAGMGSSFSTFTWIAFAIHVVIMLGFIVFNYYFAKDKVKAWAMPADDEQEKELSNWTFIVPFVPIVIALITAITNMFLKADNKIIEFAPITLFLIGIFLGLLLTGNLKTYRKAVDTTQKTLFNGISDVALLIGMLLVMNMFSTAASKLASPIFTAALGDSLSGIKNNPLIITLIFAALAPLALFRGPFMIWGSGIALASVLAPIIGTATPLLLVLFYVQPVGIVAQSCPTQSWGMWSLSYAKYEPNIYIKTNILWAWGITIINMLVAYAVLIGF